MGTRIDFPPSVRGDGKLFKLSPSNLVFLLEDCQRCFWLQVVKGFRRPRTPMAKIFNIIDGAMKQQYAGRRTATFLPQLPPGTVVHGERWVESRPLQIPGTTSCCYLRGRFDTLIQFDDGSYAVVDFKTSQRRDEHIPLYSRQLHSYAKCLERPAPGRFSAAPVTRMGLLIFEPSDFQDEGAAHASLDGPIVWREVPRDDDAFDAFLSEVVTLLEKPTPPEASPTCDWCKYRHAKNVA